MSFLGLFFTRKDADKFMEKEAEMVGKMRVLDVFAVANPAQLERIEFPDGNSTMSGHEPVGTTEEAVAIIKADSSGQAMLEDADTIEQGRDALRIMGVL